MKLFECQNCGQLLYFETTCCEVRHTLGYLPEPAALSALAPTGGGDWRALADLEQPSRFCGNAAHEAW